MSKLTPVEKQERADFVLQRLKRGFSFPEVQKQFAKEFQVHAETARKWANWACDQIAQQDDQQTRRRVYNVVVEMYHDQIVSYQNELLAMQKEIDQVTKSTDRRIAILSELEVAAGSRHRDLIAELTALPEVGTTTKAGLIEAKTRIRERMYRIMTDLARLRGFGGSQSDWKQALNTLLDNGLIPPVIASGILSAIDEFEGNIKGIEIQDIEDIVDAPVDSLELPDIDLPDE